MSQQPLLEMASLEIHFGRGRGRVTAVEEVSFKLARGGAYGLIGESGCGKSSVLRAIAGLNDHYGGSILFDGRELSPRRDKHWFKRVQMVFQDPYASLHPRKTVAKVLREPLRIHRLKDEERRIDRVLDEVGLGAAFRYRYPHQLSGGQRQRVAIARALVIEPELLLLDEPTSALDVSVQAEILNLLVRLRAERGLTYLMVSHDLAVVTHLCERVGMMHAGRIVEELDEADVRAGHTREAYTRAFLAASAA